VTEIAALRKKILDAQDEARVLAHEGQEEARCKALVVTKLDEARLWLAELAAVRAHAIRP
jgi:hypothetical protein